MLSSVAGILDGYGGWHTVVTPHDDLKNHVRPGQLLLVVPEYKVKEPIPHEMIGHLIGKVERHILWWIRTRNDPELLEHPAIKLFLLRRTRGYQRNSVDLHSIVET